MRIKTRLLWTLLGMSLLVALVGALAVNRQHAAAMVAVTKEAEDVARVVSLLLMSDGNELSKPALQEIVARLHHVQKRDVVLMDAHQLILADAVPSEIGTEFITDPNDEIGETIKDRRVRTFVEVSEAYPMGIKQIVVPVEDESRRVTGAVVLEYTPLYDEMMRLTRTTILELGLAAIASIAIAFLIALYMGRSIAGPLEQLKTAAAGFAAGRKDLAMPPPRNDEIGELAAAFDNMVQTRQRAEDELRRMRHELEVRVAERTAELGNANETLRESNEKFHQLADHITDVFWIRSPDMREVHYVSPAFARIWGRSPESLYANPRQWADFILPEDRERVEAAFRALTESAASVEVEYRIVRPDGEIRWVRVRGFQVHDAVDKLIRQTGIVTDITEEKHAAKALVELSQRTERRERMLTTTLSFLSDFAYIFDPEGRFLFANQPLLDLWGLSLEEVVGRGFYELNYPDDLAAKLAQQVREVFATGKSVMDETPYLSPTGVAGCFEYIFSPAFATDGTVDFVVGSTRDITARKHDEQAAELLLQRLNDAQRVGQIGDWEWNIANEGITWSPQVFEIFGRDPRLGPPRDFEALRPLYEAASWPLLQENVNRAIESGEPQNYELVVLRPDGERIQIQALAVPRRDESGRVSGLYGTIQDITARKRSEDALRVSDERLRVALSASGTGTFRWDIRTNELSWDHSLDALFGLPAGRTVRSLETFIGAVHPDDRPGVIERCERCAQDGADFAMEFRVLWPDGSLHWLDDRGKTFFGAADEPLYMTGACVDITDRKRAESALQKSELRYHSLFENMLEGYAYCRTEFADDQLQDFTYVEVNGAFARLTGLHDVIGKRVSALIPGLQESNPELFALYGRVALSGHPEKFETYVKELGLWLSITVYSSEREHFVAVFDNITERKQAALLLLESQQRLALATESAGIGIWDWDVVTNELVWDARMYALYGIREEDFSGAYDAWQRGLHPDDLERAETVIAAAVHSANGFHTEFRVVWPNGEVRHMEAHALVQRAGDAHMVGVNWDITERKHAEEALRASEAEFRTLTEAMPQMVWITRPDGWNVYFSQQWMDYTGLTFEESRGEGWTKPFHPDDQQRAWDAWQLATATVGVYAVECRLRRADGAYRWWLMRGVPQQDAAGNFLKWFGTCTDIHDLKMAELAITRASEALDESKRFAESIAENSTSLIYLYDVQTGRSVYSNRNTAEFLGYPPAQIAEFGEDILPTIMHPEDLPRIAQHHTDFAQVPDSRVFDLEFRLRHADGEWRWIWAREAVFKRHPNGAAWQIMGTAQDITERKRAEAELAKVHQELLKTSHQAGMAEVASSVLHNVGNVLNSVNVSCSVIAARVRKSRIGSLAKIAGLLREHPDDLAAFFTHDATGQKLPDFLGTLAGRLSEEQAEVLQELRLLGRNIDHIKEIISMQQNYAKVSGVTETVQATDLVEDSLRMNDGSLLRHDVQVVRDYAEVPPVTVEKHKVLQILVNLIRNAKYACDESGRADKQMTVRVSNGGDRVRIAVADNGVGIPAENLTRIFSHGFTTRRDGHGFGLHSAVLAAQEMGGSLLAQSDGPGAGATFTLELPLGSNGRS